MKKIFIFLITLFCFGITLSYSQNVNKFVYDNNYERDEDDGDNINDIDDIILKVSPNPAGAEAEVVFRNLPGDGTATLRLIDLSGRVHQHVNLGNQRDRSGTVRLATQSLTSGLYIVHLTTAWGDLARRILIK